MIQYLFILIGIVSFHHFTQGWKNTWEENVVQAAQWLNIGDCIICTPKIKSFNQAPAVVYGTTMIKLSGRHHCFSNFTCAMFNVTNPPPLWTKNSIEFHHYMADYPSTSFLCLLNTTFTVNYVWEKFPTKCNYTYSPTTDKWVIGPQTVYITHSGQMNISTKAVHMNVSLNLQYNKNVSRVFKSCFFNVTTANSYTAIPLNCTAVDTDDSDPLPFSSDFSPYPNISSLSILREGDYWLCDNILHMWLPDNYYFCVFVHLNLFSVIIPLNNSTATHKRSKRSLVTQALPPEGDDEQTLQLALDYINSTYPMTKKRLDALSGTAWLPFAASAVSAELGMSIRRLQALLHVMAHDINIIVNALQEQADDNARFSMHTRLAVDYMLAQSGGVCGLVNDSSCCTVIRNNSVIIKNAMQRILSLTKLQASDYEGILDTSWWSVLTSWFNNLTPMFKGLLSFLIGIFVFFLVLMCCLPCLMAICKRACTSCASTMNLTVLATNLPPPSTDPEEKFRLTVEEETQM